MWIDGFCVSAKVSAFELRTMISWGSSCCSGFNDIICCVDHMYCSFMRVLLRKGIFEKLDASHSKWETNMCKTSDATKSLWLYVTVRKHPTDVIMWNNFDIHILQMLMLTERTVIQPSKNLLIVTIKKLFDNANWTLVPFCLFVP